MDLDMKLWKRMFQELILEVKPWHTWQLTLDKSLLPNILKPGWAQYQQWTFAWFQCSLCSRNWASAQVQVLFHMHWSDRESRGQVKMRVFAQRCQKCSQPSFEVPKFTEENISRILNNLVLQILKKCYREGIKFVKSPMIKDIALKGPHNSDNCEACLQGFCVQSDVGLAVQTILRLILTSSFKCRNRNPSIYVAKMKAKVIYSKCSFSLTLVRFSICLPPSLMSMVPASTGLVWSSPSLQAAPSRAISTTTSLCKTEAL
uniref:3CxxC-type domain-containing protein n=1 Tax=Moschus moschiferus TaxID=68415 RepID=A0A8C6E4G7_MOSMO